MTKLLPLQRRRQWQTKEREEDVHEIEAELFCMGVLFYFSGVKYFSRIDQQHTRSERSPLDGLHIPLRLISPASPLHMCFFFFGPTSFTVTLWRVGWRRLYLQPPDVFNNSGAGVKVVLLAASKREKNGTTPQRVQLNLSPVAPPRRGLSAHVLCGRTYLFFTMVKKIKK